MEQLSEDCADELRACELELACVDVGLMEGWDLTHSELSRRIAACRERRKKIRQKMARIRSKHRRRADARRSDCEAEHEVVVGAPCRAARARLSLEVCARASKRRSVARRGASLSGRCMILEESR